MIQTRYLMRIGARYYCRIRWPKDVQATLGKGMFKQALDTTSREEALRRLPAALQEFQNRIAAAKAQQAESQPRALTHGEIMFLVADWYKDAQAHYRTDSRPRVLSALEREARSKLIDGLEEQVRLGKRRLGESDYSSLWPVADGLLVRAGVQAERSDLSFGEFCRTLARAWLSLQQNALAEMKGDYGLTSADPILAELRSLLETSEGKPRRTVGDLIAAYQKANGERWSQSTRNAYPPVFRLLRDVYGENRALTTLTRDNGRELLELLKALPKNIGKLKGLSGLTVPEAIKKARELGLETIVPKTINDGYMALVISMLNWAVREQWITANPWVGLKVDDLVEDRDRRNALKVEHLNTIFGTAHWRLRDENPNGEPLLFWGPLVALFTGLRLGEAAGLRVADIEKVDGLMTIHVRPHLRQLKTKNARRSQPVHPELVKMGFLQFVERQREAGHDQLFPDVKPNANGHWGDDLSDWFSGHLSKLGIKTDKLTFHSLRHSYEDALRKARLHGTAEGQYLAGRSRGKDVSEAYGDGYGMDQLAEYVAMIRYPGLDLSHLHVVSDGPE